MKTKVSEMTYEEFEKEMLLAYIRNMPVDEMVTLYIELLGHGYIHEQLIKYIEQGNIDSCEIVKKVIDNIGKEK